MVLVGNRMTYFYHDHPICLCVLLFCLTGHNILSSFSVMARV